MPKNIAHHDSEGSGPVYMGIGHTGGGAVVWAYVDGKVLKWTDHRMHKDVLGEDMFKYWRGRYEGFTGKISIVPPDGREYTPYPGWLIDVLETEFGGDMDIHMFNPPKRR